MEMSIAMTPTTKELFFVILEKKHGCDETSDNVIISLSINAEIFSVFDQFWYLRTGYHIQLHFLEKCFLQICYG